MTRDSLPQDFTIGLALVDAIPVLFFALTFIILGSIFESIMFIAGAVLCFIAGAAKVLWKLIVVIKKKNVWSLFVQMRILMPIGFLLMVAGLIFEGGGISSYRILQGLFSFPSVLFFCVGILGMVLMIIFAAKLDSSSVKANWLEQLTNGIAQICFFTGVLILAVNGSSTTTVTGYKAANSAFEYINAAGDKYEVISQNGIMAFIPKEYSAGIILYPGARVAYESYAPLAARCAEEGILCAIVHMPMNYAFLGGNAADDVIAMYPEVKSWYMCGHSLGGVMAASYAGKHPDSICGMIFLASYTTTDISNSDLRVLSVYGENDGVLNMDNYEKYKRNLPATLTEVVIRGGCHAYFGDYGEQSGDGMPVISLEEQLDLTAEAVKRLILQ